MAGVSFYPQKLSAFHQPSLPTPGTPDKGATAEDRLTPPLCSCRLMAQGVLRQRPFLPARYLVEIQVISAKLLRWHKAAMECPQQCLQTAPTSTHTATLPKHSCTQTSCAQTLLNPRCSLQGGSQSLRSLLCLPAQPVGIQFLAWHSPCL